ncbi:MAG: fibronectin type III domain-containing protein [Candidatus Schekmanbacteria bacterium]|nr:fibronectin type III domain-containing protein [Candidatus Schekmanbacteria bacterium]
MSAAGARQTRTGSHRLPAVAVAGLLAWWGVGVGSARGEAPPAAPETYWWPSDDGAEVSVYWLPVDRVWQYRLYRNQSGSAPELLAPANTDTGSGYHEVACVAGSHCAPGNTISVTALDAFGNESDFGDPPLPPLAKVPATACNIGAAGDGKSLTWTDAYTSNTGYEIIRDSDGTSFDSLEEPDKSSWSPPSPTTRCTALYRVRAHFGPYRAVDCKSSDGRREVQLDFSGEDGAKPTNVATGRVTADSIEVRWAESTSGCAVSGYEVVQSSPAAGVVGSTGAGATSFTVSNLAENTTYCFQARAVYTNGSRSGATPAGGACATTSTTCTVYQPPSQSSSGEDVVFSGLPAGRPIEISAGGTIKFTDGDVCSPKGPDGFNVTCDELINDCDDRECYTSDPCPSLVHGALFRSGCRLVGTRSTVSASENDGSIRLSINDRELANNSGSFTISITVTCP